MVIETLKLSEMCIFSEFFLGISILYLVTHSIFISVNSYYYYPLIQTSLINLALLVLFMVCVLLWNDCLVNFYFISFSNNIINDYLSFTSKIITGFSSIVCLFFIKQYLITHKINSFEYIIILLFSILGLFLLCSSNDFITTYLALELQSLSFYILAAFKKNSSYSVESGMLYFILGSFSSGLFLFGSSLIYGATGTLNFDDLKILKFFTNDFPILYPITEINTIRAFDNLMHIIAATLDIPIESVEDLSLCDESGMFVYYEAVIGLFFNKCYKRLEKTTFFVLLGILFIFVSLLFKLASAPFHLWAPDVYENSPSSSAFIFAIIPKISIFVIILRFSDSIFFNTLVYFKSIISLVAVLSVIIGSVGGLEQRKFKSLLAYSSISHTGYLCISFISESFEGFQMLFCYLIIYISSSLCIWSILMVLQLKKIDEKKQNKDLTDFLLLKKSNKILAIIFMTAFFSIAGIPPMVGFLAKLNIFVVVVEKKLYLIAFICVIFSVISTFYYIRIVKILFFEPQLTGKLYIPITSKKVVLILFLFFIFIFSFLNPSMLYLFTYKLSLLFIYSNYIFSSVG